VTTLLGHTRYLAGTTNNVNAFTDAQIIGFLNVAQKNLQAFILSALKFGFEENATPGTGDGSVTLVAGTNAYSFPTGMLTVDRIDISYTGDTNSYVKVNPCPKEVINTGLENTSNYAALRGSKENPIYWAYNEKIYIDPVPDQGVANGLKIWFTTVVTDLAIATPSPSPVFVSFVHPAICHEAAMAYKSSKGLSDESRELERKKGLIEQRIIDFYSNRDQTTKQNIEIKINDFS